MDKVKFEITKESDIYKINFVDIYLGWLDGVKDLKYEPSNAQIESYRITWPGPASKFSEGVSFKVQVEFPAVESLMKCNRMDEEQVELTLSVLGISNLVAIVLLFGIVAVFFGILICRCKQCSKSQKEKENDMTYEAVDEL